VLAEPGDNRTAAARRLRAAHTERERTVDALKAAYVQDRLTKDEFDERIGEALAARTYAELAALTVDIPVGPAVAWPPDRPRQRAGNAARWGASGLVSPVLVLVALASAALNGGSGYWVVAVVAAIVYFVVWLSAGADMLWQRHCMSQPGTGDVRPPVAGHRG
jgi:crotonobetainyl-CoA:carnitine CoA-transferase CaiB-like acyl-CoA transferase